MEILSLPELADKAVCVVQEQAELLQDKRGEGGREGGASGRTDSGDAPEGGL